jgi:protocatechuate 3,4-dioxygenase beta subunit
MRQRLLLAGRANGALLTLLALTGFGGCSGGADDVGRAESDGRTLSTARVACRPTKGEPSGGAAFPESGAGASHARLRPGPEVTADEAAREAAARRGTPLIIVGEVYADDCRTPLSGALIQVWQTDAKGEYGPGHTTGNLRCCYLLASLRSDSRGRYAIRTIRPGHYRGEDPPPPAHIHFNVVHPGTVGVATEVDFAGDPYLTEPDHHTEVIDIRREPGQHGDVLRGRFDIVVARSQP